jgi:hypothetical protein
MLRGGQGGIVMGVQLKWDARPTGPRLRIAPRRNPRARRIEALAWKVCGAGAAFNLFCVIVWAVTRLRG